MFLPESLALHGERVLLRPITELDIPAYEKHVKVAPAKFVDPKYTEQEIWELHKDDWLRRKV